MAAYDDLGACIRQQNWSETKRFTDALCSKVGATGIEEKKEKEIKQQV
jgi:hypothetical protein